MTNEEPIIKDVAAMKRHALRALETGCDVYLSALAADVLLCLERIEWLEAELVKEHQHDHMA